MAKYVYDYLGRRVMKATTSEAPQGTGTVFFIYDGWNVIAEYEDSPAVAGQAAAASIGNTDAPTRVLCWGRDLSGSLQGAGGVGGLLSVIENPQSQIGNSKTYYFGADGSGNIATIVERDSSGSGSEEVAYYGYDAFGNALHSKDLDSSGYVSENRWRFSSKHMDEETGFYYYGYRYYEPVLGRWLNRDPIGELGGENLQQTLGNILVNLLDPVGLFFFLSGCSKPPPSCEELLEKYDKECEKNGEIQAQVQEIMDKMSSWFGQMVRSQGMSVIDANKIISRSSLGKRHDKLSKDFTKSDERLEDIMGELDDRECKYDQCPTHRNL